MTLQRMVYDLGYVLDIFDGILANDVVKFVMGPRGSIEGLLTKKYFTSLDSFHLPSRRGRGQKISEIIRISL